MADEDALFAEFMGEIKSAVVEPAPIVGEDGGASPGAVSGGDVGEGEGQGEAVVDTSKRKGGEVCVVCTSTMNSRSETAREEGYSSMIGYRPTCVPVRRSFCFRTGRMRWIFSARFLVEAGCQCRTGCFGDLFGRELLENENVLVESCWKMKRAHCFSLSRKIRKRAPRNDYDCVQNARYTAAMPQQQQYASYRLPGGCYSYHLYFRRCCAVCSMHHRNRSQTARVSLCLHLSPAVS